MADFSNGLASLLGLINPADTQSGTPETDPRVARLLAEKQRLAQELDTQKGAENKVLARMGVTPEQQYKEVLDADKPKGFWKTLGKFGSEIARGAVEGRRYTPYSERMLDRAYKANQIETPRLREELDSITSQKNRLTQEQQKNVALLESLGIKDADLGIKQQNADTRRSLVTQRQPLTDAQVEAAKALSGLRTSQAALTDQKTEGQGISNINATNNRGLTGNGAVAAQRALDPKFNDFFTKMVGDDAKAKAAAKPAGKSAGGHKPQFVGSFQDPVTGLPLVFDPDTRTLSPAKISGGIQKTPTGASKDAISRAVSGYAQIEQMTPLIEKVAAKGKFGALKGAFEKYFAGKGFGDDPDLRELLMQADSVAKFNAGIHGTRSYEAMRDIYDKVFALASSPEAMKAGLRATKRSFAERAKSSGAIPRDWESVQVDPAGVDSFLNEGKATQKKLDQVHGTNSAGEPTLEQIRAEVERRRKMKGTK